jgi:hypothetical protein
MPLQNVEPMRHGDEQGREAGEELQLNFLVLRYFRLETVG